jgi:integrase
VEQCKAEKLEGLTFDQEAETYIKAHESEWTGQHAREWRASLKNHASQAQIELADGSTAVFGQLPIRLIDENVVAQVFSPKWVNGGPVETLSRLRGRVAKVLASGRRKLKLTGPNPAAWVDNLEFDLAKPCKIMERRNHAALPYAELPDFMRELRGRRELGALPLEFTILTAVRTDATIGAKWREIDWQRRVWTVPKERNKGMTGKRAPHEVPLSDAALAVLRELARRSNQDPDGYIFPGRFPGSRVGEDAMLEIVKRLRPGVKQEDGTTKWVASTHGFRSTFTDWAGDCTDYPDEIIEMAMGHRIKNQVKRHYRRETALEKRRELMALWGQYCGHTATVTPLRVVA